MNDIRKKIFLVLFSLILVYPFAGFFIDKKIELSGVTAGDQFEVGTLHDYFDGSAQTKFNSWIENNIWGRKGLIKIRSQILYSLFDYSPNAHVVLGKDKYLFEENYIYEELKINETLDDSHYEELISKLEKIQKLCEQSNKELYVFITPSKAHFFKDKIPNKYIGFGHEDYEGNYNRFKRHIKDSNIKYFDSREYIEQHSGELSAPTFYSTGIHWSHPWAEKCTIAFSEYISENSKWKFGKVTQKVEEKADGIPDHPDADLYNSMNLICKPSNDTYYASIDDIEEGDYPKVFVRGGSFMGQSLAEMSKKGLFYTTAYLENYYYFTDGFANYGTFSDYTSYDELENIGQYLSDSDMIILEVNEAVVNDMSFGFIDYLINNQDLLDS